MGVYDRRRLSSARGARKIGTSGRCFRPLRILGPGPPGRKNPPQKAPQGSDAAVIYVTRLDGSQLVVNADLIETVEHTADTVITLLDGKKLVVATLVNDIVDRVVAYRQLIARGPLRLGDERPALTVVEPTPIRALEDR